VLAAAIAAALAGSRSVPGAEAGDSPVLQEVVVQKSGADAAMAAWCDLPIPGRRGSFESP